MSAGSQQRHGAGLYQPLAEINVTPLVDVMLVLLIVFMVTAPMLAAGMNVTLPQARAAPPLDARMPVIITVARDGKLYLGADETGREQLAAAVRARLGDDAGRAVHVRGDRDVTYGDIVAVMDELARNGLVRIALITNARRSEPSTGTVQGPAPGGP